MLFRSPHVLEFSENPHQVLREVERVLRPEGSLIISGFNPRSLWGFKKSVGRMKKSLGGLRRVQGSNQDYPWNGNFIALPRIKDWLALLSFEVAGGRFAAYAPPFQQTKWLERFAFMEAVGDRWWAVSGGVYFVHAIKRVHGMRLIKPQWNEGLVCIDRTVPGSIRHRIGCAFLSSHGRRRKRIRPQRSQRRAPPGHGRWRLGCFAAPSTRNSTMRYIAAAGSGLASSRRGNRPTG